MLGRLAPQSKKVRPLSPSLMRISKSEDGKQMIWPVGFTNDLLEQTGRYTLASCLPA